MWGQVFYGILQFFLCLIILGGNWWEISLENAKSNINFTMVYKFMMIDDSLVYKFYIVKFVVSLVSF